MVPSSYHAFFSGSVSASGALIGLLFVAISVAPHKLSGEEASTSFQVKAGLAFSVLINALVLSLYALLPGQNLAIAGLVLAITGLSSTTGLAIIVLRERLELTQTIYVGVRVLALVAIFVVQLIESLALESRPHSTGPVSLDCTLVVVCLLVAIDRAWELLGGLDSSLPKLAMRELRRRRGRQQ